MKIIDFNAELNVASESAVPSAGERPVLDPQSARVLGELAGPGVRPLSQMSPAGARRAVEMFVARWDVFPKPVVAGVEDLLLPSGDPDVHLPARLYTPDAGTRGARPLLVYFHGGAYVVGSITTHDSICRLLARDSGWLVLSVGYRLAPEHPFPTAHRDAYAATLWAAGNAVRLGGDPGCLAVGGDGAGGTLAAAVCQRARETQALSIRRQMLWYPQMGWETVAPCGQSLSEGHFLNDELVQWSISHYLQGSAQRRSPLLDPLSNPDFRGLPPAFIMSAGFDPDRNASRLYAEKLRAAGIPVRYRCMETTIHSFLNMLGGIDLAAQAIGEAAAYLKSVAEETGRVLKPDLTYMSSRRLCGAPGAGYASHE